MSVNGGKSLPSPEDIRGRYFGAKPIIVPRATLNGTEPRNDLTASAQYVVREARKRIGQQHTVDASLTVDEQDLLRLVKLVEDAEGENLSERERTSVVAALSASLEHYDILSPLLENPEVNDIIVRSYKDISVQSGRRNIQTDLRFSDADSYKSFVENLLKRAGKSCTTATPVVDAAIDPHVRACVTHESFSPPGSGPMLTLRVARHRAISLDALVFHELAPRAILDYLATIVRDTQGTLLIAGEVGTGKTTLVKAMISCIHEHEAILIIEDTHELSLNRPFTRTLLTREANTEGSGRIPPAQAIRTGMRMAMNRVILGEMRDAEAAESFIDVCASGHPGMSTIHSRSARDALSRLELFLARAQGNVSVETLRKQIANALSVVVFLGVDRVHNKRRIMEVIEIGSSAEGTVQVSPLFSYRPQGNIPEWKRDAGVSHYVEQLRKSGISQLEPGERLTLEPEALYRSYQGR